MMNTMEKFDPYSYTIHIEREVMEGTTYFKASVFELPDLAVYEETPAEAYAVIVQCISDLHEAALEDGRPFPKPEQRDEDEYSGRVTLRMGKDLHKRLDLQSKRNCTTLNAEIVNQLSSTSSIQEVVHHLWTEMGSTASSPNMAISHAKHQITQKFNAHVFKPSEASAFVGHVLISSDVFLTSDQSAHFSQRDYWATSGSDVITIPMERENNGAH